MPLITLSELNELVDFILFNLFPEPFTKLLIVQDVHYFSRKKIFYDQLQKEFLKISTISKTLILSVRRNVY